MKRFINSILCAVLCLAAVVSYADEEKASVPAAAKDYLACFAAWDNNLHTLQTNFTQLTEYDGTPISTSKGRIYYAQIGTQLRLDTLEEELVTQSALTNKKQIYILDEKGKEISKISWADWLLGQPNQALFNFGNYTQLLQKHIATVEHTKQGVTLRLVPKTTSENYLLYVKLNKENCFPQAIIIESDLMQTSATLTNTKVNSTLPKDTFRGLK